jgi:hypothetical protein
MVSNSLAVFGIKDSDDNPLDISSIVGKAFDSFAKEILGVETVNGIKETWKKYSRIYQAAANILFSVQSIMWSIQEVLEVIGENVNRIGNALKKWGVVGEKAYNWMNERFTRTGYAGKFDKVLRGLESAENLTSNIDNVASEVISAQEQVLELGNQRREAEAAIAAVQPKPQTENQPVAATSEAQKAASQSPEIAPTDLVRPES